MVNEDRKDDFFEESFLEVDLFEESSLETIEESEKVIGKELETELEIGSEVNEPTGIVVNEDSEDSGDEDEETPTNETETEVNISIEGNPLKIFAQKWIEEGKLPEDFAFDDNITSEDIDLALYEYKSTNERQMLENSIRENFLKDNNINEEVLENAKRLTLGITDEDLKVKQVYSYLANVQLDSDSEFFEEDVLKIGIEYYVDKDFSQEMAEKNAKRDIEDNAKDYLEHYQNHFVTKALKKQEEIDEKVNLKNQEIEDKRNKTKESLQNFYNTGKIGDSTYTPEQISSIRDAIEKKDQIYTYPNGKKVRVTLEQKKILESRQDFNKYLKARFDFILGYNTTKIEQDARVKGKKDVLKDLASMVKVNTITKEVIEQDKEKIQDKNSEREEELLF